MSQVRKQQQKRHLFPHQKWLVKTTLLLLLSFYNLIPSTLAIFEDEVGKHDIAISTAGHGGGGGGGSSQKWARIHSAHLSSNWDAVLTAGGRSSMDSSSLFNGGSTTTGTADVTAAGDEDDD